MPGAEVFETGVVCPEGERLYTMRIPELCGGFGQNNYLSTSEAVESVENYLHTVFNVCLESRACISVLSCAQIQWLLEGSEHICRYFGDIHARMMNTPYGSNALGFLFELQGLGDNNYLRVIAAKDSFCHLVSSREHRYSDIIKSGGGVLGWLKVQQGFFWCKGVPLHRRVAETIGLLKLAQKDGFDGPSLNPVMPSALGGLVGALALSNAEIGARVYCEQLL